MTDSRATKIELETGTRFQPSFDRDGLLPAIVTDGAQGGVLMFAFMNADALQATLRTGYATFYSRSRARLWVKGEESGNKLRVIEIRTDCDQDVLWIAASVEGAGAACHTGARSCFYRVVGTDGAGGVALRRDAD
ncbi:MAG: phosphoribosyl-AMP cyclohydrolase [Hyphomicrobiales bacterium]|nr:phosphoribosyl-AMP cyclohydrolase [Hyphomicrobiales bacterium]